MTDQQQKFITSLSPLQVLCDESLLKHTAFRLSGKTAYYVEVQTIEQLITTVKTAREHGVPIAMLGSGTNALFAPEGFSGLLIKNNCRKFEILSMKGSIVKREMQVSYALMQAESGAITNLVVRSAIDQGFAGLEYASSLPGTIGGAIAMNANYPKENKFIGEAVYAAKILTKDNEVKDVDQAYFQFGFDQSILQRSGDILLSVIFKLYPDDKAAIVQRAQDVSLYRSTTQPKNVTAGVTFRNIDIKKIYKQDHNPHAVLPTLLLEQAGFAGLKVGKAGLFEANPRYILNLGDANADDVAMLIKTVQEGIFAKFCVQLEFNEHRIKEL